MAAKWISFGAAAAAMERLKAAIYTVDQLHPIRVRFTDEGWMIVDGQRRWLALCAPAKEHPNEPQFQTIRALQGATGSTTSEARGSRFRSSATAGRI
jgi:hypothetical protein